MNGPSQVVAFTQIAKKILIYNYGLEAAAAPDPSIASLHLQLAAILFLWMKLCQGESLISPLTTENGL
jgi:hypothetical protein